MTPTHGWRTDNRGEQAVELCRDVAQFANSDGGVLLIGVTEMAGSGGQKVAGAIRAIDDVDGLRNWIEQAIRTYLTPPTFTRSVIAIETAEGTILAVDIRPSLHLVALWHKQHRAGIEYLYRTDHGKQFDLAVALQHKRTADFRFAALCIEASSSVVNIVAIVSGRRDKDEAQS